jgi:His/Glu/Gln/Arg/opine family amino acid ABC transporter permease subunit
VVSRARIPQLVEELKTNHIDALLVSIPIAKRVVQSTTDLPLDVLALPEEGTEAAAIATAKDAPHTALLHTKLASLVQEGAVEALVDKWIASPDTTTTIAIDDQHSTTWYIIQGIRLTLQYTIIGLVGGFLLAIPLLFAKLSRHKALRALSIGYTSIFRGTPLLVQLCIVYYGLPNLTDVHLPAFVAASLTFSLNSAAYVSEILLGGVRAIDAGQEQAARALGLSRMQIMRHILLPQTFRNVAPSLMNEMIDLLKESSLVSIIGEADIMRRAQIVSAQNYNYMTPLLIAAACYYVLVILLSQGVKWTNYYLKRSI